MISPARWRVSGLASLGPAFAWISALLAALLAVTTDFAAQTTLCAAVGLLYLLAPPRAPLPRPFLYLPALLLLLALPAFLPAAWTGSGFRQPFLAAGFSLAATRSPQPWWTWEDLTLAVISLLWAWACLAAPLTRSQREQLLALATLGLATVAGSTLIRETSFAATLPGFVADLGRFPNRNQTGDLLWMGGLLAFGLGLSQLRHTPRRGAAWLGLACFFLIAIARNGSRAALLLFGSGLLLLLLPKFGRGSRRSGRRSFFVLALFLIAGPLILIGFGGDLGLRFRELAAGRESRWATYADTLPLLARAPGFGVGLGNFEGVYNIQRHATAEQPSRSLHPESDWLWLAADWGLPAVAAFAALVALLFRDYLGATPFPELTRLCRVVALLFLGHSLFDVAGHRLGTIWTGLYLVGLGASRPAQPSDLAVSAWLWRGAGLLVLALAGLRLQSMSLQPWVPSRGSQAAIETALRRNLPVARQEALLDQALAWAPLDWLLYYQRGRVELNRSDDPALAERSVTDFQKTLFLERNTPTLRFSLYFLTQHATALVPTTVHRMLREEDQTRPHPIFPAAYFSDLPAVARSQPLAPLADSPEQTARAVQQLGDSDFEAGLQLLFQREPDLAGVPGPLARALFQRWAEVGSAATLVAGWPSHPAWHAAGWCGYALALNKLGRSREAVAVALASLPPPPEPAPGPLPTLAEAGTRFAAAPSDLFSGIEFYQAQSRAGQAEEARQTLEHLVALPGCPAYINYRLAQSLYSAGRDPEAWSALAPLLPRDNTSTFPPFPPKV